MQEHPLSSFNEDTVLLRLNVTVNAPKEGTVDINMPCSHMPQLAGGARGVPHKVQVVLKITKIEKSTRVKEANELCVHVAAAEKQRHHSGR
jgi:hypothetical protein